ncbi:MAG: c-type cytochrome [Janthinobacterium lividum]
MAQDTKPDSPETETPPGFHYYSGGEVKELENTPVSPLLWGLWTVVILAALGYLFYGGALGPHVLTGGFKPTSGSRASLAAIQTDINKNANGNAETAQAADMSQLVPFLGGESLTMAVSNGSTIYQTYCIGCHGPNQDGNGVNASSLNPKPRNLHDGPFMRETMNYNRINTSLHYGVHGTAMPRWENTLSEHQIQEVISYALSLTWTTPSDASANAAPTASSLPETSKKSPNQSTTGTPGGSTVHGGSVSNSPEPITPTVEGNPAADTSTAPPSQSGQPAGVNPKSIKVNTPVSGSAPSGGPAPSREASPASPGSAPGGM